MKAPHPWMTRVFALELAIALRCKREQSRGRRGKEPCFVHIDIKSTRVYP